jgi:hypothetical protein
MSALSNQFLKARTVIQALVHGLHPATGFELPKQDIVNDIDVNRALSTSVMALDQMAARLARRELLPEKVGKSWTQEEEQQLRDEFGRGESVPLLAEKHCRTIRAIESRLVLLGVLPADQRTTRNRYSDPSVEAREGK